MMFAVQLLLEDSVFFSSGQHFFTKLHLGLEVVTPFLNQVCAGEGGGG